MERPGVFQEDLTVFESARGTIDRNERAIMLEVLEQLPRMVPGDVRHWEEDGEALKLALVSLRLTTVVSAEVNVDYRISNGAEAVEGLACASEEVRAELLGMSTLQGTRMLRTVPLFIVNFKRPTTRAGAINDLWSMGLEHAEFTEIVSLMRCETIMASLDSNMRLHAAHANAKDRSRSVAMVPAGDGTGFVLDLVTLGWQWANNGPNMGSLTQHDCFLAREKR